MCRINAAIQACPDRVCALPASEVCCPSTWCCIRLESRPCTGAPAARRTGWPPAIGAAISVTLDDASMRSCSCCARLRSTEGKACREKSGEVAVQLSFGSNHRHGVVVRNDQNKVSERAASCGSTGDADAARIIEAPVICRASGRR
jgi:hypothetical protein